MSAQRWRTALRIGALPLLFGLAALITFVSQAASPDYNRLWLSVVPYEFLELGLVLVYFISFHDRSRWFAFAAGSVATAAFAELTFRVWGQA